MHVAALKARKKPAGTELLFDLGMHALHLHFKIDIWNVFKRAAMSALAPRANVGGVQVNI